MMKYLGMLKRKMDKVEIFVRCGLQGSGFYSVLLPVYVDEKGRLSVIYWQGILIMPGNVDKKGKVEVSKICLTSLLTDQQGSDAAEGG